MYEYFQSFKKNLADYGAFMKLVKLQSWLKCVQSWNVNNTYVSEIKFWNSDVQTLHKTLFDLVEKGAKTQNQLNEWKSIYLFAIFFPNRVSFSFGYIAACKNIKLLFCCLSLINKALCRPDFLTKSELSYLSGSAVAFWAYLLRIFPFFFEGRLGKAENSCLHHS